MDQKTYHDVAGSPHMTPVSNARVGSPVLTPPNYPQTGGHHLDLVHSQPQYQQVAHPQQGFYGAQQHDQHTSEKPQLHAAATPATAPGRVEYRTAIPIPSLSMSPAPVDCPMCHERKMTRITPVPGNTTHAWAGILFCFTIIFAFVPYVMKNTKDVQHNCGHCGAHLATWHKSGQIEVFAYA